MEQRVTLLHRTHARTHAFAALYCVTCVVCNYDNVYLIACLLILCRLNDAVTLSQSSFILSYMRGVMLYPTDDYFDLVSRVCGPLGITR
jgi:energy-coupling factor transporter transmembrane protein EcfT